jgi:hypothetical protein
MMACVHVHLSTIVFNSKSKMDTAVYPVTNIYVVDRFNPVFTPKFPKNNKRYVVYTHTLMKGAYYMTSRSVDTYECAERGRKTLIEQLTMTVKRDKFFRLLEKMAAEKIYHLSMDVIVELGGPQLKGDRLMHAATVPVHATSSAQLQVAMQQLQQQLTQLQQQLTQLQQTVAPRALELELESTAIEVLRNMHVCKRSSEDCSASASSKRQRNT